MLGLVLVLVLVLLSRGRDIGTLGVVGHHGHVVVLKAVFLAADLTLEAIPLALLRRSGVRQNEKRLGELSDELVCGRAVGNLKKSRFILKQSYVE